MKYWASIVMGINVRMIQCLILLFIVLKIREEDKRFRVDAAYIVDKKKMFMINGIQCEQPLEDMYNAWGDMAIDGEGTIDQVYIEMGRHVLEDWEQAVIHEEGLECEI